MSGEETALAEMLVSHARLLCNRKQRNSLHGHMNHVSVALRPESCPHQSDLFITDTYQILVEPGTHAHCLW